MVPTPKSSKETILFCSPKIANTQALVNGKLTSVVLDSGASIPIANGSIVSEEKIFEGKRVEISDWKNETTSMNEWSMVKVETPRLAEERADPSC